MCMYVYVYMYMCVYVYVYSSRATVKKEKITQDDPM